MPPQIVRLVLVTIGIVSLYAVARYFLTPPTFGDLGYYRAQALGEAAAQPVTYAGKKACEECHSETLQTLAKGDHKTLSCESCHGPAQAHVENPELKTVKIFCTRCHGMDPARPSWIKQIDPKKHYTGERCVECHLPHQPKEVP